MPRETIHPDRPVEYTDGLHWAEVGWDPNGYVQLRIRPAERPDNALPPAEGLCVDLDRHQINKAIRVLRRARDQAYGADE